MGAEQSSIKKAFSCSKDTKKAPKNIRQSRYGDISNKNLTPLEKRESEQNSTFYKKL